VIKISFFDKINYGMIVNAFKQVCDRRHREVFFTNVPQVGAFQMPANTEMLITHFSNFSTSIVILKSVCLFVSGQHEHCECHPAAAWTSQSAAQRLNSVSQPSVCSGSV